MIRSFLIFLFATSLILSGCSSKKKEESSREVIKIGLILPMTGYAASWGEHIQKAITLAHQHLPPELQKKYQLVLEDGRGENQPTPGIANKLININHVDALISCFDNIGNIIAPLAREKKIPHICIALDDKLPDGQYNFAHWTPAYLSVDLFLKEAQKRGIKTLAILGVQHQFPLSIVAELEKQIKEKKVPITIIHKEYFAMDVRDVNALVVKAANTKPDLFLILTFPPSLELLGKKFKDLKLKNLTAIESFKMTVEPQLFEGCWYVAPAVPKKEYAEDYQKTFGISMTEGAPNAYDAFNLLVQAFEKDRANPVKALQSKGAYEGVLGESYVYPSGIIETKPTLQIIKNGISDLVEEIK